MTLIAGPCSYYHESNAVIIDDDCDSCSSIDSEVIMQLGSHDPHHIERSLILSSLACHWSFGFHLRSVEEILRTIPRSLEDDLYPLLKALHMNIQERVSRLRRIQSLVEQYTRNDINESRSTLGNFEQNGEIPSLSIEMVGAEIHDCGLLCLPFDSVARPSFNSMFASIIGLDASDLEQSMNSPDVLLPFDPIDFLCMTVHDIEHFTDDSSLRYARFLSACRTRATLVSILTRKDYNPFGEVKGVRDRHLLVTALL